MKKVVNYKVNGEEWVKACDKAFEKLNKTAKIDGFRPGKAPRSMFEKKYGKTEITMEAANDLIDAKYHSILVDDKLIPVVEPKVDIVKIDDKELEVNFTIIMDSEVSLGDYKNLGVKKETVKVTKEEVDHRIHHLLEDYAELAVKEGKVEKGNIAIIDFEGFRDGVAFEGGKGENYSLEIGSNTFIPGFEDAVIGMKVGEEKDIDLTFPKDYGAKDLAGAKVVFKVKVNEIKERIVPELDKDFFLDLGMEGITNEKELRTQIEEEIKEQKEHENEHKYIDALLDKASSNMKVEIDDEIVDAEAERMYSEFMQRMSMQGINEEMYLQYAQTTKEDVVKQMNPEALKRVKNRYLLEAVIKEEKLSVSDKDAKKELKDMAVKYNMTEEEVEKAIGGLEMLKYDMTMRKAIDVIKGEISEEKAEKKTTKKSSKKEDK